MCVPCVQAIETLFSSEVTDWVWDKIYADYHLGYTADVCSFLTFILGVHRHYTGFSDSDNEGG